MIISEVVTLFVYVASIAFLQEYFGKRNHMAILCEVLILLAIDLSFVITTRFAWKVAVIVAISAFPLYIIKLIRSRIAPAASSKLL